MSQEKLVNFRCDEELYLELKKLALKERTTVKSLLQREVSDYVKKHKDGNPQFTLEQFKDPNFMATPAFYRNPITWENYLKKQDTKELLKVKNQILAIEKKLMMYL